MRTNKGWKRRHDEKSMRMNLTFRRKKRIDNRYRRPRFIPKSNKDKEIVYTEIPAPKQFSLVKNESDVLAFICEIQRNYDSRTPVFIRMEEVNELGNGAILLLLANMIRFRSSNIPFNGSKPKDSILRKKLEQSGFFNYLYRGVSNRNNYDVGSLSDMIYTHAQKEVDAGLADKIIEEASQFVWSEKRRCPGVQRTLVELMHNTNNHAGQYKGEKHWWISSNKNVERNTVTLSFMDFGMGIFDSLNNKRPQDRFYGWKDTFKRLFPWAVSDDEVLKLILEGNLHKTVTRENFRGKGLPGIYSESQRQRIGNLIIISNGVYADVKNNDYHMMNNNLSGTFVSCELNKNIFNLPW